MVNPWFVVIQPDHETLDVPECGTWSTLSAVHRDLESLDATPSSQTNFHGRPMQRFVASVTLRHVSHLSDALIGQARWDDPAVEYEASIVLGEDDTAAWEFVNSCRRRMARLYKHNMSIIRSVEKSSFGKNSYYRLVENGLFKTPEFEGDYSGQAPYSDTEDEEDNGATEEEAEDGENATEGATEGETEGEATEDTGDNDVSGERDNVGEYSDHENMTDGIESGSESGKESDSESNSGDDGEE